MAVAGLVRTELGGIGQVQRVVFIKFIRPSGAQGVRQTTSFIVRHLIHIIYLLLHRMTGDEINVATGIVALKVVHEIEVNFRRSIGQCDASVAPGFLLLFIFTVDFSLQASFAGFISFQYEVDSRTAHVVLRRSTVHHFRFFHARGRHTL